MGLGKYFQKRRFGQTPEPKGSVKAKASKRLAFVVQEHHASQLHYDFRLELDGVLKSWAVPKGPSLDPKEHHLAVAVEDHPYAYRKFEGVIPEGQYGAGNVIIWDEGWYEPRAETTDPVKTLRKELRDGHLTFILHGKKLQGEFALIRMHNDDNWLLVKKGDRYARVGDLHGSHKVPDLSAYPKKARITSKIHPMLATLIDKPFNRDGWLFEIKWDGYRAIAHKHGSDVELYSRSGQDFLEKYPEVAEAVRRLKHDVILDGEIVVTDADGQPEFEKLQNWHQNHNGNLRYYVFDLLWCDGRDLRQAPLLERKRILHALLAETDVLRYSDHIEAKGEGLFKEIRKRGLEGVVAKQADSPYHENERGPNWLKIKTQARQEVVIGGFTEPRGSRKHLGSLLVGIYRHGQFIYTGHSGGGIPDDQRRQLREQLLALEQDKSPFVEQPTPNAPVHWVQPKIICEMSFSQWTSDGLMRHPKFEGLRSDKVPRKVHQETPAFTHLDKVFFPKHNFTKGDLIDYYTSVAPYILPYLKDRPLSLLRQPHGITDEGFFQKNMEHLPDYVPGVDIFSESHNGNLHWMVGGSLATLLYAVQLGSIEINPWNSRVGRLDKPDWIVIDLDPNGKRTFKEVVRVAQTVKAVCDDWQVSAYPKTSGKTGLHIYIPMAAKYSYEQARNFAHLLVIEVSQRQPKLTSIERVPDKRPNQIYLDWLQNRAGQTLAAPYSVRPTPDATVSMPLHWDEVTPELKPTDFTIKNALRRLKRTGDLWKPVTGKGSDLAKVLKTIETKHLPHVK